MLLRMRNRIKLATFCFIVVNTILFSESVFARTVILGPGKVAVQDDVSYKISFKDPSGFEEDKSSAENNGLVKLYIPKGKKLDESFMIITVAFKKKASSSFANLDSFIKFDIDQYRNLYKSAKIDIAQLPEEVTNKFQSNNMPFMTLLFKCNSDKIAADAIILFFETPDGFWSISYTAPMDIIQKTRDIFLMFLKEMDLEKRMANNAQE